MNFSKIKKERHAMIGALIGNVIEFYDFMVFLFLIKYMIYNFFPQDLENIATLKALTVSMAAYFVRPAGALFFGRIGDKRGRKKSLLISILMATMATACIGLLPIFKSVGFFAPLLLLLLRALQGFSVSGEQGGAAVFLRELLGEENSNFAGALVVSSIFAGILLGSLVCCCLSVILTDDEMFSWGWRLPFLFAFPLGIISFWYRASTKESPIFLDLLNKKKTSKYPVKELFLIYWKQLLLLILIGSVYAATTSIYMVFVPNYLSIKNIASYSSSMFSMSVGLLFMCIIIPIIGAFMDRVDFHKTIKLSIIIAGVVAMPAIINILSTQKVNQLIGQAGFIIMISLVAAPIFTIIVETFPPKIRCVGVSFVFNTSITLFSALTPVVAFMLVNITNNIVLPSFCIIIPAVFCFLAYKILLLKIKHDERNKTTNSNKTALNYVTIKT